jgi:hypothetical protein
MLRRRQGRLKKPLRPSEIRLVAPLDRNKPSAFAVAALAAAMLCACSKAAIVPKIESARLGDPPPGRILVYDFSFDAGDVTANQGILARVVAKAKGTDANAEANEIGRQVAERLSGDLVDELRKSGLAAVRADAATSMHEADVLVRGHFVDIDEGNRARRMVIGFGAGASKLDADVQVEQQSTAGLRQLLQFRTHADSGKMPGAAATMGVGAAAQGGMTAGMTAANVAVGGAKAYGSQVEVLASDTADKVAAFIADFARRQGWIAPASSVAQAS